MSKKRRKKQGKKLVVACCLWIVVAVLLVLAVNGIINVLTKKNNDKSSVKQVNNNVESETKEDLSVGKTSAAEKLSVNNTNVVVMIDPGHGGDDPGTMNKNVYEKDITLKVALKVKEYLEECGITVMLTREDDMFINKYDRAELANEAEVDLFVSIHCNFLENNPEISGVETYYIEGVESGEKLATALHESVLSVTGADDMYVRTEDFVVIKNTSMPASLIEIGYLSNAEDVVRLTTAAYQKQMAYGIAAGIIDYINDSM